ncbi:hypothetical protein F2P56_005377 [Juglans regia]|uniref:Suppressor protein SRP40-like n=2 Tax=Juglans regia TaxID=51240 RepID=A0A834D6X2_JUGRE|nr:vascular-related unknown protein 4-like [Juglans regia]KAF5478848.1 hypothetical protein F2P56_005377 [Juglans regia]
MSKPTSSNQRTSEYSSEESGWTVYFEDFSDHKTSNEHSNCSSGSETSSLASDAASLAGKRSDRSEQLAGGRGSSMVKTSKRSSSFKKTKRTGRARALVENALVDTASSPINMSPKVCDMNEMDMDADKRNDIDHANISQEKVVGTSGQIDERSEVRFVGRDSDCTELKKKGLCLVPLSTIGNYLR